MGGGRLSRHGTRLGDVADSTALDSLGVPAVARRDEIDPTAEGVDTDRIEALLHRRADDGSAGVAPRSASATGGSADVGSPGGSERRVSVGDGGTEDGSSTPADAGAKADEPSSPDADDTRAVDVSPFTSLLVDQAAEELSPDAFVNEAVDAYVLALLSGEVTGDEAFSVDVGVDPAGDDLLRDATVDAGFDSLSAAVIDGIETALDADARTVYLAADQWALMDAAVTNEGYAFTDYTGFVDAAVARALAT